MSFKHGSFNVIPRMTVTPQSRLRTSEDTILDTSTSHMFFKVRLFCAFIMQNLKRQNWSFWKPTKKFLTWKNLKMSYPEMSASCPETERLRNPVQILHMLYQWRQYALKTVTSSILQMIVRISAVDKDETSPRGFFRYSLATEDSNFSLIENYGSVSL